jgi:hypothetical protein
VSWKTVESPERLSCIVLECTIVINLIVNPIPVYGHQTRDITFPQEIRMPLVALSRHTFPFPSPPCYSNECLKRKGTVTLGWPPVLNGHTELRKSRASGSKAETGNTQTDTHQHGSMVSS